MDIELVKYIAKWSGGSMIAGIAWGAVCAKAGIPDLVALIGWFVVAGTFVYFVCKADEKKQQEAVQEAMNDLYLKAYRAGAEEAEKGKTNS